MQIFQCNFQPKSKVCNLRTIFNCPVALFLFDDRELPAHLWCCHKAVETAPCYRRSRARDEISGTNAQIAGGIDRQRWHSAPANGRQSRALTPCPSQSRSMRLTSAAAAAWPSFSCCLWPTRHLSQVRSCVFHLCLLSALFFVSILPICFPLCSTSVTTPSLLAKRLQSAQSIIVTSSQTCLLVVQD